jgi:hypothetical protein
MLTDASEADGAWGGVACTRRIHLQVIAATRPPQRETVQESVRVDAAWVEGEGSG